MAVCLNNTFSVSIYLMLIWASKHENCREQRLQWQRLKRRTLTVFALTSACEREGKRKKHWMHASVCVFKVCVCVCVGTVWWRCKRFSSRNKNKVNCLNYWYYLLIRHHWLRTTLNLQRKFTSRSSAAASVNGSRRWSLLSSLFLGKVTGFYGRYLSQLCVWMASSKPPTPHTLTRTTPGSAQSVCTDSLKRGRKKKKQELVKCHWPGCHLASSDGKLNSYKLKFIRVTHQRQSGFRVRWVTESVTQSVRRPTCAHKLHPLPLQRSELFISGHREWLSDSPLTRYNDTSVARAIKGAC